MTDTRADVPKRAVDAELVPCLLAGQGVVYYPVRMSRMRAVRSTCFSWIALLTATALLAEARVCRGDDTGNAAQQGVPPQVRVELGGAFQSQQPTHEVTVTSDREATRLLAVYQPGVFGEMDGPRQQVCTAPCTAQLTPSGTYMIRGYAIVDSAHFGINQQTRELHIHTGSTVVSALGTTALTLGILSAIAGTALLPVGLTRDATDSARPTLVSLGWITLLGGVALIALGIGLDFASVTHAYDGHGALLGRSDRPRLTLSGVAF